jgi:hypothetical protein
VLGGVGVRSLGFEEGRATGVKSEGPGCLGLGCLPLRGQV